MSETLKEIFFESSARKSFKDKAEEESFYWKYMGFYLARFPELLVQDPLGYCLGAPLTRDRELYDLQPHLKIFDDLYDEFPAHLHINCHVDARGKGLGRKLLEEFENRLEAMNIKGVHLITSADARNRSFYSRAGYSFQVQRESLLFMGKRL